MHCYHHHQHHCHHLDVQLKRHRAHVGVEVEECGGATSQPLRHITGIRQRRGQRHNADVALQLWGDVTHAGADDLQHWLSKDKVQKPNLSLVKTLDFVYVFRDKENLLASTQMTNTNIHVGTDTDTGHPTNTPLLSSRPPTHRHICACMPEYRCEELSTP